MAQNNNGDVILARRVGDFLRRELKNRRMQQYKFAMDFGCGERTVNRWINEGVDSLADVVEIADFFGVSVRDVLFGDDDIPLVLRNLSGRMKILPDFFIFRQNVACYDEKIAIQCGCRGEKAAFFQETAKIRQNVACYDEKIAIQCGCREKQSKNERRRNYEYHGNCGFEQTRRNAFGTTRGS